MPASLKEYIIQRREDDGVRLLGMREPLKGELGVPELKVPELPE